MDRFFKNEKTGEYLLFPDSAVLSLVAESHSADSHIISINVELKSAPDLALPPPQRQIVLTDESLNIERPEDSDVLKLRFVKTAGLRGSLVITVKKNRWPEVKRKIVEEEGYLTLSYKGNSESYWRTQLIAKIDVSDGDRARFQKESFLFDQLLLLRNLLLERTQVSTHDRDEWLQYLLDSDLPIVRVQGRSELQIRPDLHVLRFDKMLESTSVVTGNSSSTEFKWLN